MLRRLLGLLLLLAIGVLVGFTIRLLVPRRRAFDYGVAPVTGGRRSG